MSSPRVRQELHHGLEAGHARLIQAAYRYAPPPPRWNKSFDTFPGLRAIPSANRDSLRSLGIELPDDPPSGFTIVTGASAGSVN
ncbi:MAG TPA: hypothetical protein VEU33_20515, partial [Archangium sp.]|nr:hypothetical protein [Archangium sp.]